MQIKEIVQQANKGLTATTPKGPVDLTGAVGRALQAAAERVAADLCPNCQADLREQRRLYPGTPFCVKCARDLPEQ